MASTLIQEQFTPTSIEQIKAGFLALLKEKDADVIQALADFIAHTPSFPTNKKRKKKVLPPLENKETIDLGDGITVTHTKNRPPYHEMPFWKANPHLKPRVHEGPSITMEAIKELQVFFQEPGNEITDEWFEMLD